MPSLVPSRSVPRLPFGVRSLFLCTYYLMFLCPRGTVWRTRSMLFSFNSLPPFSERRCSSLHALHARCWANVSSVSLGALFNAFRQCLAGYRVQMIKTNNLPSHSWWHKNDLSEPNAFKEHESQLPNTHSMLRSNENDVIAHFVCVCFCIAKIHRTPHCRPLPRTTTSGTCSMV